MFRAVEANDMPLVEFYLGQGVDVNYQHPEYFTNPFFESIRLERVTMVALFLTHGACLAQREILTGSSAQELATQTGNREVMALFAPYL